MESQENRSWLDRSPVFRISRVCGLFPFDRAGRFDRSGALLSILSTVVIGVVFLASSCDYSTKSDSWFFPTFTPAVGIDLIEVVIQIASVNCHLAVIISQRDRFQMFLSNFLDENVGDANLTTLNRGFVLVVLTFAGFAILRFEVSVCRPTIWGVMHSVHCFYNFLVLLQFTTSLTVLKLQLSDLIQAFPTTVNIHRHALMLSACEELNDLFQCQCCLIIVQTMCSILSRLSYFVGSILKQFLVSRHGDIFSLLSITFTVYQLSHLIETCMQTKQAADLFHVELVNVLQASNHLLADDKLYLYAVTRPTVDFTASGFVNLSYPLVTSIFATGATCLVMMVQFSMLSNAGTQLGKKGHQQPTPQP